jgi:CheY-like chemotaxis protein/HPt (histidine-containing phosphotransfer) domain-containing protein
MDENDPFRIAVIDMQMPGMDGDAVGRAIKVDKRLTDIQMVMLTSMVMHGDILNYQDAGFAAYTTKPIRYQELKSVLSLVLADSDVTKLGDMEVAAEQPPVAIRHTNTETMNLFAGCKARILLAEDNITNQLVAQGILKKLGLRADAVANGAEAIRALETLPYDLVLMDVQMPEMDGIEATKTIRSYELRIRNEKAAAEGGVHPSPAIPIIAMTAHAMQGDRERCLAAGMNDYITKPVTPAALADVLDKWLPKENDESRMLKHKEKIDEVGSLSTLITDNSPLAARRSPLIFDREGMLSRLMEDEDLAKMVAESFLEDIPLQIDALKGYLEAGDATGAERQAHTIKGASANVGGERLRAVAFEMEKAAKAGELRAAGGYIPELEAQFAALSKVMKKELLKH